MIDTAETLADYLLPIFLVLLVVVLFAAHIPGVRRLTGAAPLQQPGPLELSAFDLPLTDHSPEKDTHLGESTTADGTDGGDQ